MNQAMRTAKIALTCAAALMMAGVQPAHAEDVELPSATEVQYFSPEAQQFYTAGVAALDTADYSNAYNMLVKAGALQPGAVNLNRIVAKLAMYHGRQSPAEDARDYYETAINNFSNILRIPTLNSNMRRVVMNELKIAQQERDALPERDVVREASGTQFLLEWNRKYATKPARTAGVPPAPTPGTTLTQALVDPAKLLQGAFPQTGGAAAPGGFPGQPGMPGAMPGGMPGSMPGDMPGMPGSMPGSVPGPGVPPPAI